MSARKHRGEEMERLNWSQLLAEAAAIVATYDTLVTLRQLFYRLVATGRLPNTINAYKALSRFTAEARRLGSFPALMDRTRTIHRHLTFDGPTEARAWLSSVYRRDRTAGQKYSVYLGVEKAGLVAQVQEWFGELGVPILALGGYGSQSYIDDVVKDVEGDGRPAVLLYAGDHDPSGEDIDRDFVQRTDCWAEVRRVALTAGQVAEYSLPAQPGKVTDSRAARFIERHGHLVQVELDALPPDVLRSLLLNALSDWWDESAFDAAVERERRDRRTLRARA